MGKHDYIAVYERPVGLDYLFIRYFLRKGIPVRVIEPFYAYHHRKGVRFFPRPLPAYVEKLVSEGRISVIRVNDINADSIYLQSSDKAVEVIEAVYPHYRRRYERLISHTVKTLGSVIAEDMFRKNLCDRLADFYSQNMLHARIEALLPGMKVLFFPDANLRDYFFLRELVQESGADYFENHDIRFSPVSTLYGAAEGIKKSLSSTALILMQTIASALLGWMGKTRSKKTFSYGMAVIGLRQLRATERGPDFIVDNKKIRADSVVYFPLIEIKKEHMASLSKLPGTVFSVPRAGRFFSDWTKWLRLFIISISERRLCNGPEMREAAVSLFQYFCWRAVMDRIKIRHFITHCDFGYSHIARNLALAQAGVKTYYFTDSMNFVNNFNESGAPTGVRHPFWSYLYYDHFVTWDESLAGYFNAHPKGFKESHIVGCLWSGHIQDKDKALGRLRASDREMIRDKFVVAAFDSTYSKNGAASYIEGIAFAADILRMVEEDPDMHVFFKEKKARGIHKTLDSENGPRLAWLYAGLEAHPRITMCSNQIDASLLMSVSDFIVSFPFTSTTFEALSVNRPAIWHDPMGLYVNTSYADAGGVTTHDYDGLKSAVLRVKGVEPGALRRRLNPLPTDSPLLDPYRDGRAIERFRDLLTADGG